MRLPLLALLIAAAAAPAAAQAPAAPSTRTLATVDATLSGQPIDPPAGPLRVTVGETTLPAGGRLAPHKHPYPRVVNVLSGRLKVTNLDTGQVREVKAGDWMVDAVEQWHEASVVGDEAVRILTIDQAPPGAAVTIPRAP
jgi:quercetin dioxygenase-like cupin family protein